MLTAALRDSRPIPSCPAFLKGSAAIGFMTTIPKLLAAYNSSDDDSALGCGESARESRSFHFDLPNLAISDQRSAAASLEQPT